MKEQLAIIGTGIAGLGCAHFLNSRYDLTVFEQNDYIGGHTNTITIDEDGTPIPIDTGFMVFNNVTYPNLTRLFQELEVEVKPTEMSFSVRHLPDALEYNGMGMNKMFAQRGNLFRHRFWRFLFEVKRFFEEGRRTLLETLPSKLTLAEFIKKAELSDDFLNWYLVPMGSAVWSTPPDRMLDFPAISLLRFFHNHGFLGITTHHPWKTVANGSIQYVKKIIQPFAKNIYTGDPVTRVERSERGIRIATQAGAVFTFDRVIFATHADQALRLLATPTRLEESLLFPFRYQSNVATLHTDESVMPTRRLAWASWNYHVQTEPENVTLASTHYWMNALQQVSKRKNYFVSINGEHLIDPQKTLKRIIYDHPTFDIPALEAQAQLHLLHDAAQQTQTHFCGSYFRYGFHEDAFTSALELVRHLTGEPIWS